MKEIPPESNFPKENPNSFIDNSKYNTLNPKFIFNKNEEKFRKNKIPFERLIPNLEISQPNEGSNPKTTQLTTSELIKRLIESYLEKKEKKENAPAPVAAQLKKKGSLFPFNAEREAILYGYDHYSYEDKRQAREAAEQEERQVALQLNQFFTDKGIDHDAVYFFARNGLAGDLFTNLVLRNSDPGEAARINIGLIDNYRRLSFLQREPNYNGTQEENALIDSAIAESDYKFVLRREYAGRGATRIFNLGILSRESREFGDTEVVVIGAGPAGEMMVRAMIQLGFNRERITVVDKTGEYGGVWNQKNVAGGSINSPFEFDFQRITLDPAPGEGTKAREFLRNIEDPEGKTFFNLMPKVEKGTVISVEPGDLSHTVTIKTPSGEIKQIIAPIVINAIGNGKPLDPSRESHMTTDTPKEAGIRWQQILTPERAEKYKGKTLVFIGLGNSTAEMLIQLKKLNEQGYNIDYRVLTHYSKEAVDNPTKEVIVKGKVQRVYRDLKKPNLTKYEGDLLEAREAYELAQRDGKIISDVTSWHAEDKKITVTLKTGEKLSLDYEQLFTLIGYGHDSQQMRQMGMNVVDEYKGTIATDFDGEVQREKPSEGYKTRRGKIYPGYFAIGAVAKTDLNPNAIVMPGIMHRMYDALHTLAYRSREHKAKEFERKYSRRISYSEKEINNSGFENSQRLKKDLRKSFYLQDQD